MPSISGALTAIATVAGTVTGIVKSYDVGSVPETIDRSALPCSLVIPENGEEIGFQTLTFLGNAPIIKFSARQQILYAPEDAVKFKDAVPGLITLLDNYLLTLKAMPFLTSDLTAPPIHQPVQVKPTVGIINWGGVNYHGISFNYINLEIYI